jgi:hypothetical protein
MGQIDEKAFTQRWIKTLIEGIDAHLDEETQMRLMEACGRACARGGGSHRAGASGRPGWLAGHAGQVARRKCVLRVACWIRL